MEEKKNTKCTFESIAFQTSFAGSLGLFFVQAKKFLFGRAKLHNHLRSLGDVPFFCR